MTKLTLELGDDALDALKMIVSQEVEDSKVQEEHYKGSADEQSYAQWARAVSQLRDAIAKAEGSAE